MKRAILAALAALSLLCASTADAAPARALLLTPRSNPGSDQTGYRLALGEWSTLMSNLGIYFDSTPGEAVPTSQAISGQYYYGAGGKLQSYDLVIDLNWYNGRDPISVTGCNGDSLTLYAPWAASSRVIHIFAGPGLASGLSGVAVFGPAARCSTGAASGWTYSGATENTAVPNAKTLYVPGKPWRWKDGVYTSAGYRPISVPLASGTPGILRPLIAMRTSVVGSDGAGISRQLACDDCDSLVAGEGSFADTAITWARYRSATDTAPNIFTWVGTGASQGQGIVPTAAMLVPLALADSLLGGRLIGQKPGWQPIRLALMVKGAFQRTVAGTGDVGAGSGCGISVHDSTRYKEVVRDSVAKFGIPVTFTYQPDSVASYAYEKAWYAGLSYPVKFMPISYTDQWAVPTGGRNTSTNVLRDWFGYLHARKLGFYGMTAAQSTSLYADTCTACLVKRAFAKTDSIWPGKTCYAVFPPISRLLPSAMNVKLQGGWSANVDSINAALWWAGVRTVVTEIDNTEAAPNTSWSVDAGGSPKASTTALYPLGSGGERRFNVYADDAHSQVVGSILYAPVQINSGEGGASNLNTIHNYANHFLNGVLLNRRARQDNQFYYHTFRSQNHVYRLDASSLHGTTAAGAWPRRHGWWSAKAVVNPTLAANAFGRRIFQWVFVDELN